MSFPAPLIKNFHYSRHDRARTATRERSDFSFISVTVQMPRNFFTVLGPQQEKKAQKRKKKKKAGVSVLRLRTIFARQVFQKKELSLDLVQTKHIWSSSSRLNR